MWRIVLLAGYFLQNLVAAGQSQLIATALGGSQSDTIRAIAVDPTGTIYVAGETYSSDFPGPVTASSGRRTGDAFVARLDSSGTKILYCVILSGAGYESARGIALDASGNAYATGVTTSPDFPVTAGAFQRVTGSAGVEDAFVAKIGPTGNVVYSTYLGGAFSDTGYAIALDAAGSAYVAGGTASANFPATASAFQRTSRNGGNDCFVAKVNATGTSLVYSTYLGGASVDVCKGIAVDSTGAAFVTGTTTSPDFPVSLALRSALSGPSDAFLAKLSAGGDRLLFSTYLGGEGADDGNAVRLDGAGNAYVGGDTASSVLPGTSGAVQALFHGVYDGFVCEIVGDGSRIVYATYLGGTGSDAITDLTVGSDGRVAVAGYTGSADFPLAFAAQTSFGGSFDAFAAVFGAGGQSLDYSTLMGGTGDDRAYGVGLLRGSQVIFAGQTVGGSVSYLYERFTTTPIGQYQAFVASFSYADPLRYVPITPCRAVDTRYPNGLFGSPMLSANSIRDFVLPASACGIPASARAYAMVVSVIPSGFLSYLTMYPAGTARPFVSTINSDGRIKSVGAIVPAGTGGAVSAFTTGVTHVVLDVTGYFVDADQPAGLAFYSLTPCRVVDTRHLTGSLYGPALVGGQTRTFPVKDAAGCNIPSGVQAYSVNLTVIPKGGPAYWITAYASGQARPIFASLTEYAGTITSNAAIVPAGINGSVDVYANATTDFVIDINGYFAAPGPGGLSLYPVLPCRAMDSRLPTGSQVFNGMRDSPMSSSLCGIPFSAAAHVLSATVVPSGSLIYITLWAQGQLMPIVSTLSAVDASITSNLAIVPTVNGAISSYVSNPTQLVFDVFGYFAP